MKRLIPSLFALAFSSLAFAAPPATTQSNTRYAVRQVHVETEFPILNTADVNDFANKRAGELGVEILHVDQDDLRWLDTSFMVNQGSMRFDITVKLSDPATPPAAKEIADRLGRDVGEFIKTTVLHS